MRCVELSLLLVGVACRSCLSMMHSLVNSGNSQASLTRQTTRKIDLVWYDDECNSIQPCGIRVLHCARQPKVGAGRVEPSPTHLR